MSKNCKMIIKLENISWETCLPRFCSAEEKKSIDRCMVGKSWGLFPPIKRNLLYLFDMELTHFFFEFFFSLLYIKMWRKTLSRDFRSLLSIPLSKVPYMFACLSYKCTCAYVQNVVQHGMRVAILSFLHHYHQIQICSCLCPDFAMTRNECWSFFVPFYLVHSVMCLSCIEGLCTKITDLFFCMEEEEGLWCIPL